MYIDDPDGDLESGGVPKPCQVCKRSPCVCPPPPGDGPGDTLPGD